MANQKRKAKHVDPEVEIKKRMRMKKIDHSFLIFDV